MESPAISLLDREFTLSSSEAELLDKSSRELNRPQRRELFQKLKPREKEFREYLKTVVGELDQEEKKQLKKDLVDNLLSRGGEPSIADGLLMDALGRLEIYKELREASEREGVKLKPLTNFGGIGMVIILFGVVAAVVLYLTSIL